MDFQSTVDPITPFSGWRHKSVHGHLGWPGPASLPGPRNTFLCLPSALQPPILFFPPQNLCPAPERPLVSFSSSACSPCPPGTLFSQVSCHSSPPGPRASASNHFPYCDCSQLVNGKIPRRESHEGESPSRCGISVSPPV